LLLTLAAGTPSPLTSLLLLEVGVVVVQKLIPPLLAGVAQVVIVNLPLKRLPLELLTRLQ
jgi:hypothetical protein